MQISYTINAFTSLTQLVNFIERKNTAGAGLRWLEKYEQFLKTAFSKGKTYKLCTNETFKTLHLNCIYYNDWVIAFSVHPNFILIEALFHKSRISD